jgi:phosphoenolpyruvate carboxykinase (GTP)
MAMVPFLGYHMGDYWAHWLEMGRRASNPPAIFQVNWFRRDEQGQFIWPGFGENMRVLRWIHERVHGSGNGHSQETPIGIIPTPDGIGASQLDLSPRQIETLLTVDREAWRGEAAEHSKFLAQFEDRLPDELSEEQRALERRLAAS